MEINPYLTSKAKNDYDLIVRALEQQDQQAYAELLNHYREAVYYMILKMTNNATDAEDLTIEAFGKAFKNLPFYSPQYAFSTWLFRIASNNCIDFMRKKQRNGMVFEEPNEESKEVQTKSYPSDKVSPEEKLIQKEQLIKLRVVIAKLKPHYRLLVELRYFKEYSYEEIAVQLKLPLGTVKAQLFRAREFLQNLSEGKK